MRNYTTQLLKDITDKMDLIAGEEEIDYFSYLRGSDITEGMHCGGYKEAIANALSAANAFEHEIRKDAEEAKAKLTAIFLEAERADVQCYMTLREVSETLKDWMLLARKLRLSMTGGGGYGEQLFCENNIKQWTGETAARLEKESYSAEERAEDRNEAFLAGEYTGGMPSEIKEGYILASEIGQREDIRGFLSSNGIAVSESELVMINELYLNNQMTDEQEAVFFEACKWLNTPYSSPGTNSHTGIDCSGLVMTIYNNISNGTINLPHRAVEIASGCGMTVSENADPLAYFLCQSDKTVILEVGDVICFDTSSRITGDVGDPYYMSTDHVGIFVGYDTEGKAWMIDASSGNEQVVLRDIDISAPITIVKRIM